MPELPELVVVNEVLQRRVVGATIESTEMFPSVAAIVVRDLAGVGFVEELTGTQIARTERRGKFLVFELERARGKTRVLPLYLVINPKLTGRLQLACPGDSKHARTAFVLRLSNGLELRYFDQKKMGQVYLTFDLLAVPDYAGMALEPFDISFDEFRMRLKGFRGEIKGILTRGELVAGIGNAYADEILWAAGIYPFRKSSRLTTEEITRFYAAIQSTLRQATDMVRHEMGERIELKPRDFLAVHMRTGEPCPRCGTAISLVGANQRITNFCRTCQPGSLLRGT